MPSSEANLPPRGFSVPTASLTKDSAGLWYVISPEGESPRGFVVIEHQELKFAFYAIPVGERAAQVLPLTPVRVDWFNAAMQGDPTIAFVDDLEDVNIDGGLALWAGQGAEQLRWLGRQPRGRQMALVMPARAPARGTSMPAWAKGIMTFEENRVITQQGAFAVQDGPYLVLPDGLTKPHGFRVGNISGEPIELSGASTIVIDDLPPTEIPEGRQNTFALMPLGRSHLADALVFRAGSSWGISLVEPANGRIGRFQRLEASLAEVPWTLGTEPTAHDLERAIEGLRAIFDNHPLVASYWIGELSIDVHGNRRAAELRRMELIAAAGFGPWMRAELLDGKRGAEGDESLYIARSFAFEGQWQGTEVYAGRAYELFGRWPHPQNHLGRGRADLLTAQSRAEGGDFGQAVAYGRRAGQHFEQAGDVMMHAQALHHTGLYYFDAGDPEAAVAMMERASELYREGGASYFGLLTKFRLGRRLVEAGKPPGARIIAEVGERFDALSEPIATNRAHIAATAVDFRRVGHRNEAHLVQILFEIAQGQGDRIGAMAAATLLIEAGRIERDEEIIHYGTALTYGLAATNEAYYTQPAREALMVLCTRGLPASVEAVAESAPLVQSCDSIRRSLHTEPGAAPIWLTSGYGHIQMGRWERARSISTALGTLLTAEFKARDAKTAADILLFQAALVHAEALDLEVPPVLPDEQTSAALIQQAFDVLKNGLSLDEAGPYLHELAQGFRVRGLEHLALTLTRASLQAASNQRQAQLIPIYTLALAVAHYEVESWKTLGNIALPEHEGFARRVALYKAHGLAMSGDVDQGSRVRAAALTQAREVQGLQYLSMLIFAAQLDLERGALEEAEEALREAIEAEESLEDGVKTEQAARVLAARLRETRARLHAHREQHEESRVAIQNAVAIISELPAHVAGNVRVEVLETAGLYATSEEQVAHYIELLQLLRTQLVDADDLFVLQMAVRAQARLEVLRGQSTEAYALLRSLFEDGLSPSTSRHAGDCLIGEIAIQAGNMNAAKPALERCARHDAAGEKGARARLWLAFADKGQTTAFRLGLVQHLERISPGRLPARESQRLALIKRLPQGSQQPPDATRLFRLEAQLEERDRGTPEARAEAVEALVSYFLGVGRAVDAEDVLNRHGSVFFDAGEESEATLVRLRLASLVYQLRPIEARIYARRAMVESGPMPARIEAEIALLQAQNSVVLGQWFAAAHHVSAGLEMAREAGDTALERALSELATSVPLPMNP